MAPSNANVAAVGVVVVSVVTAAAIAIYENPEVRQFAEDCRRKIAVALHSLGDEINPASRQPRFNRPEDAEGFMRSGGEAGLDGDEESRRRQREELMYWNQVRLEKEEREASKLGSQNTNTAGQNRSFDDFLHEDSSAEKGTYVYNTGTDVNNDSGEGLVRRGHGLPDASQGNSVTNPFADEHHIDMEEHHAMNNSYRAPSAAMSEDIYGLDDLKDQRSLQLPYQPHQARLIDVTDPFSRSATVQPDVAWAPSMYTSGADAHPDAFASIHAWAENSHGSSGNSGYYSPLPISVEPAMSDISEPEHVSGQLTPTDSESVAGSGVDMRDDIDAFSAASGDDRRHFDVISDDGGVSTPGTWTEVGSVVSEEDIRT